MPSHLRPAATRAEPPVHAPNAALLIDFDNVTLGVRSEFTKELRTLLNSDIIKGKVAVQRAYADWRRYPQYIVPLSESSIDLIFAPAYGSSKFESICCMTCLRRSERMTSPFRTICAAASRTSSQGSRCADGVSGSLVSPARSL